MILFSKDKENNNIDSLNDISSSIFDEHSFVESKIDNNIQNLDDNDQQINSAIVDQEHNLNNINNSEDARQDINNISIEQNSETHNLNNNAINTNNNNHFDQGVNVKYIVDNSNNEAELKLSKLLHNIIDKNNTNISNNINIQNNESNELKNIKEEYTQYIDNNSNLDLQELLDLKVQEYQEKYPECIENLIEVLKDKKYNKLSNDIKYLLIRFLAEDANTEFLEKYNSYNNEEKLKIINSIIADYKKYIHYDNINLDELDYYYITPFILFLNRENENKSRRRRYLFEMKAMINNRIEKKNIDNEIESGNFNDLDRIKRRIEWYQKTYPDVFANFKKSFTKDEFNIMSLGQKCILLRILTEGVIKNYYQNLPNEYEKQKFILEISKLYKKESKENNFSYDWFFSGFLKFEDYLKMRESLIKYEKKYITTVNKIKDAIGEAEYQDMPIVQKYAVLKYLTEPIIQNIMQVVDNKENESTFIHTLCDNFAYIFDKDISIRTFNAIYNKIQKDLYDDYQQILQQQNVSQAQLYQNKSEEIVPQQQSIMQNSLLSQQNMQSKLQENITQQQLQQNIQETVSMPQLQQNIQHQNTMQKQIQNANNQHNIQQQIQERIKKQQELQQQHIVQQQKMQKEIIQQATQKQTQLQQNAQTNIAQNVQNSQLFHNNTTSLLPQQSNINNKNQKLVLADDNINGDTIIYFAGYKDKDKKELTLYKMRKSKFEEKRDHFINAYNILSYRNREGKIIPIIITEEHYNNICDGSKEKCLAMIKETLFELKTSNVSDKIKAFKSIKTVK